MDKSAIPMTSHLCLSKNGSTMPAPTNRLALLLVTALFAAGTTLPRIAAADETEQGRTLTPDMFSEKGEPVTLHNGDDSLTIPAPDGFVSPKSESYLLEVCRKTDENDTLNDTYAHWFSLSENGEEVIVEAYLKENKTIAGRRVTPPMFRRIARSLADAVSKDDGFGHLLGMRTLPPHRDDADRLAYTMVVGDDGEDNSGKCVTSCCLLWLKGRALLFYVQIQPSKSADDVVAKSRAALDAWCDAAVSANNSAFVPDAKPAISIPPPTGFHPISALPKWKEVFGAIDEAKSALAITYGHWIAIGNDDSTWEALAMCPRGYARSFPLWTFLAEKRQMENNSSLSSECQSIAKELSEKASPGMTVGGIRNLAVHASDDQSYSYSHIRSQMEIINGESAPTFTVGTTCAIWIRNRCVCLTSAHTTTEPAKIDGIVEATRETTSRWKEAFYRTNGLTGEIADAEALLGHTVDDTPGKPHPNRKSSGVDIAHMAGLAALIVAILFLGLWLRKKDEGHGTGKQGIDPASSQPALTEPSPAGAPDDAGDFIRFLRASWNVKLVVACCGLSMAALLWEALHSLKGPGWIVGLSGAAFAARLAHCILAGRKWPQIYLLVGGLVAFALGILERATVPADVWTSTSRELVVGGLVQGILGALLSCDATSSKVRK